LLALSFSAFFSIDTQLLRNQGISLIISLIAFFIFSHANFQRIKKSWKNIYILSLISLIIVLIIGVESRGAVRWISLFGLNIQVSEIVKPFLLLSIAGYLSEDEGRSLRTFLFTLFFLMPIAFLIYKQPDLGSAVIFVLVVILTLLVYGFRFIWFVLVLLPLLLVLPSLWGFLHEYQRQRFLTFFNPTRDPLGTSYNIVQAIIAVGSGTFFGKGLSEGTQSSLRFLPERHTDFIFATLSESLGFFGSGIILLCFGVILFRIFYIFQNTDDAFIKIFAASSFFLISVQAFINIGMNLGMLPVVGITLPFVSYGGNSLLANFILLGILTAISGSSRKSAILEIQ
ncbi:MAG: rod shape-determining protein RodA, partial [Candidatus Levybacteria bacterium]|nr:rod shape-determining protein RodA [Candidatus Levybacteria bacterium]